MRIPGLIAALLLFFVYAEAEIHPLSLSGQTEFENKNYDVALLAYNQLIQEFPYRKEGYFNRALCLYKTEKYSEAIFDLNEAFALDTLLAEALLLKAFCLEKRGDLKEAVAEYEFLSVNHASAFPLKQRISNYYLSVFLSTKWYYLVALLLLSVALVAIGVKSLSHKE